MNSVKNLTIHIINIDFKSSVIGSSLLPQKLRWRPILSAYNSQEFQEKFQCQTTDSYEYLPCFLLNYLESHNFMVLHINIHGIIAF